MKERIVNFQAKIAQVRKQVGTVIVGQEAMISQVLMGILAGGHVLLEGVPGLGKTLLVKTLGGCLGLQFSRVQFCPDLMPSDVLGTQVLETAVDGSRNFRFQAGPVFTNLLLADEINRATPKTQSALLEAMQEKQVTVAGQAMPLPAPFFVLATQNPLEMEGTYPLPEAQLDRFLFKIQVPFPSSKELSTILDQTTGLQVENLTSVCSPTELVEMQRLTREVVVSDAVRDYVAQLIVATQPSSDEAPAFVKKFVRYGSSPRGGQALILASKAKALLEGRFNIGYSDIEDVLLPCLRHRIQISFEAQAEGMTSDQLVTQLFAHLKPVVPA